MKNRVLSAVVLGLSVVGAASAATPARLIEQTQFVNPTHIVIRPSFGADTVTALCAKNHIKSDCKVYVNCTGKAVILHGNGWMNAVELEPRDVAVDPSKATRIDVYNTQRKLLSTLPVAASDSQTNSFYAVSNKFFVAHKDEDTHCGL